MCFNKTNQPYRIHLKDLNRFAEEYSQIDQDWTNIKMTQYNQDQRALVDILPGILSMLMLSQSLHVSSLFFVCTHMTSRPGESSVGAGHTRLLFVARLPSPCENFPITAHLHFATPLPRGSRSIIRRLKADSTHDSLNSIHNLQPSIDDGRDAAALVSRRAQYSKHAEIAPTYHPGR